MASRRQKQVWLECLNLQLNYRQNIYLCFLNLSACRPTRWDRGDLCDPSEVLLGLRRSSRDSRGNQTIDSLCRLLQVSCLYLLFAEYMCVVATP